MEDLLAGVIRDLPSTGILVLFVWFVSKQFTQALEMLKQHLDQLNSLIEQCIKSKDIEEKEREIEKQMAKLEVMLQHVADGRINRAQMELELKDFPDNRDSRK